MKYIEKTEIEKKREDFILKENTLIQRTVYMFTKQQQDMLAYILSEVRPHDPKDKEYLFNATDFIHVASKNDLSGYTYQHLQKDLKALADRSWWEYGETANGHKIKTLRRWIQGTSFDETDGKIKIKLSEDVLEYLIDVKSKYTTYQLENVLAFKSKYTTRLYELMKSYENMKQAGHREAVFRISVEKLKVLLEIVIPEKVYNEKGDFQIVYDKRGRMVLEKDKDGREKNKYPRYFDFKKNVLEKSVEEICDIANDIDVSFREIRRGKTVREIEFTVWSKIPKTQEDRETTERRNKRIRKHDSQHNGMLND